jgi:hypothetical protein
MFWPAPIPYRPAYATLDELRADLAWPEGMEGRVWSEPGRIGLYVKVGRAGGGLWRYAGADPHLSKRQKPLPPNQERMPQRPPIDSQNRHSPRHIRKQEP